MADLDREKSIFADAIERAPNQRSAFVRHACDGDHELESRILRLLAAHERTSESLLGGRFTTAEQPDAEGEQIGPYRILERIGHGGMGIVYLAEQILPVRRRVAIKVIKLGMDTKEVIARFDAERQALALMNHTNIARILDAGATEDGRPYFVMEYVPGIPIVDYCDAKRLAIPERLRLLAQVCHAIQHAHQKGVIHRDLKPSNILITEEHEHVVPKVIDFGVAKAVNRRLSELTLHTEVGRMIGTPEYMSPEQAGTSTLDIDTRSDVYSLGVLMYELLVGARPFELRDRSVFDIQQEIREKEPTPPSSHVRASGQLAADIARMRDTSTIALHRQLRGELDWITLRALSKDRRRRYQTALALAEDIERHLGHMPVEAGPPSVTYRMSKFTRRHAAAIGAATTMLLFAAILLTVYTVGLARERDRANREATRASEQARTAEQVTDFLVGLFEVVDPSEARGHSISAREVLDRGADRVTQELAEQPEVQARLLDAIGRVYLNLGLYRDAQRLLEEAVAVRRRTLGSDRSDVALSLNLLGESVYATGDYEAAESLLRRALALRRETLGEDDPRVGESLNNVGAVLWAQGDHVGAEPYYRDALALRRRLLGEENAEVAQSLNNLAVLLHSAGDYSEAESLYRETLAIRERVLGIDHPHTINSMNNLGAVLRAEGRLDESEDFLTRALALRRTVLGETHPEVAESLEELAMTYQALHRYDEAESLLDESYALRLESLGHDHPLVARSRANAARLAHARGDHEPAAAMYVDAIELLEASLDPDHWRVARTRSDYASCLTTLSRYAEAEQILLASLGALRVRLGDKHHHTATAARRLNELYVAWDRPTDAAKYSQWPPDRP